MVNVKSVIRSAPGADGPFFVVTEKDGVVSNVTLGIQSLVLALDQSKSDQQTALAGSTWAQTVITTTAT